MKLLALVGVVVLALGGAACGGPDAQELAAQPLALVVNSPGTMVPGEVRLLVALLDQEGGPLAAPDLPAQIDVINPDTNEVLISVAADFVWTVPDSRGLYVARVNIPNTGVWGVVVTAQGFEPSEIVGLQITDAPIIPVVGVAAPPSVTPTGAEFPLDEISSDPTPNPRFYESSLGDVVGGGVPVVVVFATPALCTSAACGPMLDVVDEVSAGFADVNFVHVEVYTNLDAQQGEELELAPAIVEWGLPSEPWVFVVDGPGVVTAAFEGAILPEELVAAIEAAS